MGGVVKAIVGLVAIVAGVILENPYLVDIGISLLLNAAASLFIKADHRAPLSGISVNYTGTLEPRRIIYGTLKIGGLNVIPP